MEDRCERAARELYEWMEQFYGQLPEDLRKAFVFINRQHFSSDQVLGIMKDTIKKLMAEPSDAVATHIAKEIMQALELSPDKSYPTQPQGNYLDR